MCSSEPFQNSIEVQRGNVMLRTMDFYGEGAQSEGVVR